MNEKKKVNPSVLAAAGLILLLILWMASSWVFPSTDNTDQTGSDTTNASGNNSADNDTANLMSVEIIPVELVPMTRDLTLNGQVKAARILTLTSNVSGTIETLPVNKGSRVNEGTLIATLSDEGRSTSLEEARSRVRAATSERNAAEKLRKQGLQSQANLEQAQATLATAQTALSRITLDIQNTQIKAPFNGVLNQLHVELGQRIDNGTVIGELVDDSRFIVTGMVAQQSIAKIKPGQTVTAKLITGETLNGTVTYISASADQATRSFAIEATLENPENTIAAGVSASLVIPTESLKAFFVSPSSLALGENGEIGVKSVNDDGIVEFHAITIVQTTQNGAWVTGVDEGTSIIGLGQGFVNPGEKVTPVMTEKPAS